MPFPVSRTENSRRVRPTGREMISTYPASVNFSALVVRLSRILLSASGRPSRKSDAGAVKRSSRLFSSAIGRTMSSTPLIASPTWNGEGSFSSICSLPRASSMTSLVIVLRPSAAL